MKPLPCPCGSKARVEAKMPGKGWTIACWPEVGDHSTLHARGEGRLRREAIERWNRVAKAAQKGRKT